MENSIVVTTVYRNVTAQNHLERLMTIPVPVLAKELETYKTSHHILTYLAVPIAVWGCFGNFFSFRLVFCSLCKSKVCMLKVSIAKKRSKCDKRCLLLLNISVYYII